MSKEKQEYHKLTKEEESVIVNKGTEMPFTGKYYAFWERGTYVCKRCGQPLYRSESKFEADCGWPSFDDEIPGAVKRLPDADGVRTEIQCAKCGAHLGHVFVGERFHGEEYEALCELDFHGFYSRQTRLSNHDISAAFYSLDLRCLVALNSLPSPSIKYEK